MKFQNFLKNSNMHQILTTKVSSLKYMILGPLKTNLRSKSLLLSVKERKKNLSLVALCNQMCNAVCLMRLDEL